VLQKGEVQEGAGTTEEWRVQTRRVRKRRLKRRTVKVLGSTLRRDAGYLDRFSSFPAS
jgi:hypothetical protein